MSFQGVPFNAKWTDSSSKEDMRAIYRRPNGDLTSDLPLRRHSQWEAKGFTYVTLADADSFAKAVPFLRSRQLNPQDFVMGHDGDGRPVCWNLSKYLAENADIKAKDDAELKAMIEQFGVEAVEKIKGIKVPEHLRPKAEEKPATTKRDKVPA